MEQSCDALDTDCLELCISLLDHDLKGDLFESAVIRFLAAITIDPVKGILKEAYHFTPTLSGFIKIAQMFSSDIHLSLHTFSYPIPPRGSPSCSHYVHGMFRASERHNLDL